MRVLEGTREVAVEDGSIEYDSKNSVGLQLDDHIGFED